MWDSREKGAGMRDQDPLPDPADSVSVLAALSLLVVKYRTNSTEHSDIYFGSTCRYIFTEYLSVLFSNTLTTKM